MTSHHAKDGWSFERLEGGAVRVHWGSPEVPLGVTLTAEEWASVVASVSHAGEEGGRFYDALAFHTGQPKPGWAS